MTDPLRIVLPGGTGHVGNLLARHFHGQGHHVTVISRSLHSSPWHVAQWDGASLGDWVSVLEDSDVVINLAGRSVKCRYSRKNREEIMNSRVVPTRILGEAIARLSNPPRLWMNASTATIYRHAVDKPMDEISGELGGNEPDVPDSWKFSIDVATNWEHAFFAAPAPFTRRIALRSAIVLSPDHGSIFDTLLRLVRFGLGGTSGAGNQFVSWIHDLDFVRVIDHLIQRDDFDGVVNIASPHPIPNSEFMRVLRRAWGTPFGLPAPEPLLAFGAFLLRMESELMLKSRWVIPQRLLESGFQFQFANWNDAASDLVRRWRNTYPPKTVPRYLATSCR